MRTCTSETSARVRGFGSSRMGKARILVEELAHEACDRG